MTHDDSPAIREGLERLLGVADNNGIASSRRGAPDGASLIGLALVGEWQLKIIPPDDSVVAAGRISDLLILTAGRQSSTVAP
jgi:hypothetical protein